MPAQKSTRISLHLYEKISEVADRLDEQYGPRTLNPNQDPVGEVVQTVLSQHTSDVNSGRAYASLRAAFPTWESVIDAPSELIAESIRSGGLADQKAPRIQHALETILSTRGEFDLSFLSSMAKSD